MNMKIHTYEEIAEDYRLWMEYVDPSGIDTIEAFNSRSVDEKVNFLIECFGAQPEEGQD